jgi:hypothetical protein
VVTAVLAGKLPVWSLGRAIRNLIEPADPAAAWEALGASSSSTNCTRASIRLSGGERQRCGLARLILSDAACCWSMNRFLRSILRCRSRPCAAQEEAACRGSLVWRIR